MEENSRHFFFGISVLNPDWIAGVKTGGPYLILAEGVLMYLTEAEVRELFNTIHKELESAEIVFEVTNRYWVDKMNTSWMRWKFKRQLGMTGGAIFTFGVPYGRYFETWSQNYMFLDEWTYFDDHERKLGWFNLFSSIDVLRKVQWTLHYRIGN